jgi:hypothetical protein
MRRCQVFTPPLEASQTPAQFKAAHFVKTKAAGQTQRRVIWAWNAGGTWAVPDNPRLAYAGYPVLYKLHLDRELASANELLEEDPALDLLRGLLAEFEKSVALK